MGEELVCGQSPTVVSSAGPLLLLFGAQERVECSNACCFTNVVAGTWSSMAVLTTGPSSCVLFLSFCALT
jgi:hypothetical protein